jgi:PIN domain nuclease of toxin-antitoxin system
MRLLRDTPVLLWALSAPKHLSKNARSEIENSANDVMFSAARIWEIPGAARIYS